MDQKAASVTPGSERASPNQVPDAAPVAAQIRSDFVGRE
jgi:hypothetical protein